MDEEKQEQYSRPEEAELGFERTHPAGASTVSYCMTVYQLGARYLACILL